MPAPITATTLKPAETIEFVRFCLALGHPCLVMGSPGIGKTAVINTAAALESYPRVIPFIGSQKDETDATGAPAHREIDGEWYTVYYPPSTFPRKGKYVIFFDEVPNSKVPVQGAFQQAFTEHRLGDLDLPPEARIVAAGNYVSDRAGANRLQTALSSRVKWCHMVPDAKGWIKWGSETNPETGKPRIHPMVLAFNQWREEFHYVFDHNTDGPFPCPRSYEKVSEALFLNEERPIPEKIRWAMNEGELGTAVGAEFNAFENFWPNLVSVETIIMNPATAPVPGEVSARIATVAALSRKTSQQNIRSVMTYLDRLEPEFQSFGVQLATGRDPILGSTPELTKFHIDHPELTN